jgi:hypothetical protein
MPKADSFTALGRGNGFSQCLNTIDLRENRVILNPPTLEQTMSAYWNIDSVSFGGAEFDPTNEPKDLICTPTANQGTDINSIQNSSTRIEQYVVSIGNPFRINDVEEDEIYYAHNLNFQYNNYSFNSISRGDASNADIFTDVIYTSTLYHDDAIAYACSPSYYHGSIAYYGADEIKLEVSEVTIEGIPFIRTFRQSFSGTSANAASGCPIAEFNPGTDLVPSITLHTY